MLNHSRTTTRHDDQVVSTHTPSKLINAKMPSAANSSGTKKFFMNKSFYLHVKGRVNTHKAAELIKLFGGQIDEFLETSVSYVLTDIPKHEWPPAGSDVILKRARTQNVKLMSLHDLMIWCSKYVSSQSSSDEDEDSRVQVFELRQPYIKIEDLNGYYAPVAKEIPNWPMFNQSCPNGKALFQDCWPITLGGGYLTRNTASNTQTPNHSVQLTPQMISSNLPTRTTSNQLRPTEQNAQVNNNNNNTATAQAKGVKRRHSIYCEVCNLKLSGKLEEHIQSSQHKAGIGNLNWNDVHSVIQSVPSFSSLSKMRKGPSESIRLSDQHEFLCLHKVESVSQLFMNTTSKEFHSLSPQVDRQLVQIQ